MAQSGVDPNFGDRLGTAEKFQSTIFDNMQAGLAILDREYHIVTANNFFLNWLKRTPDEVRGQYCYRLIHNQDEICSDCPSAIAFRTGEIASTTHTGLDKEGGTTFAEITAYPVMNSLGEVECCIEYVKDVSVRMRFEQDILDRNSRLSAIDSENDSLIQALRESEERFRNIFEESPIAIELYDSDGRLQHANQACLDLFGVLEASDVNGFELFEDPNVIPEAKEQLRRGETARFEALFDFEKVKTLNLYSTSRSGAIHLDILINPLRLKTPGTLTGYLVQVQDITERKNAERDRESLLAQMRQINEQLAVSAVVSREAAERERAAREELRKAHHELETRVKERTLELAQANADLRAEIAERQKMEQALLQSEARWRGLVETTSDWVWEVDENAVYTYVSPRVHDLLGYEPQEMLGKRPFDLMPLEEAQRVVEIFEPIAAQRMPFGTLENVNRHKDGHLVVLDSSGVPFFDMDGAFRGYRGIDRDITERRRAREALEYRLVVEEAVASVSSLFAAEGNVDLTHGLSILGRAVGASRAYIFQFREGGKVTDTTHEWCAEGVEPQISNLQGLDMSQIPWFWHQLQRNEDILITNVAKLPKGATPERTLLEAQDVKSRLVVPLRPPLDLLGFLGFDDTMAPRQWSQEDVRLLHTASEILVAYLKRKQAEDFREEYIHTISHDLRNPLMIIRGHAQLLQRATNEPVANERNLASIEAILTGAQRMHSMIEDLVDSARLESRQMRIDKRPIQLKYFLRDLLARARAIANVGRVEVDIPSELPAANADPDQLERIVLNLLTNALKYSPVESPVLIKADQGAEELTITVADHGYGISAADLPRVFERFYRAKDLRQTEGLGLGLYITNLLVEANGGRIWVESELDKGSAFHFTLPLA